MMKDSELQEVINATAVRVHGSKLTKLALGHLREAWDHSETWLDGIKYIQARENRSKSWSLAAKMFGAFVEEKDRLMQQPKNN
jgi:hypothetical protein